ncbi:MAG: LysR family transcriptional regulator [Ketobacter sp.]|nr:MAG: LysR family transcriptional regulator [Ketobacter sp.]
MKLNLRSIDLNLLTIFDAIMQHKRMSAAAEALHMTQPAVSHALARLRTTFQDELFIRTRSGMQPTPQARQLAGPIREALLQIQDALQSAEPFDPMTAERTFKIAFAQYGEMSLLPSLLNKVNQQSTRVGIQSVGENNAEAVAQLKDGGLDFCFDMQAPNDERLESCLFTEEDWVVIARRDHPRYLKRISAKQYFEADHIVLALKGGRKQLIQRTMADLGGERRVLAETQQLIAIPSLVMQTDAIATIPSKLAEFPLYDSQLRCLKLPFTLPKTPFYLIWHRAMNNDRGHNWMKDLILQCR